MSPSQRSGVERTRQAFAEQLIGHDFKLADDAELTIEVSRLGGQAKAAAQELP